MNHVWIVDDEPSICWALRKGLESNGFQVSIFSTAESCLDHAARGNPYPAVVLLDVHLPGKSGLELLPELQTLPSKPPVIVMTAFGDLKIAVEAVRGKAFDYLTKPFDLSAALDTVHRAVGDPAIAKLSADSRLATQLQKDMMLGSSPAMQRVYKQIAIAAPSDSPVLIYGEQGTGKSIVAAMIHRMSSRASHPFLFFRPDANRPAEAEAELFGSRQADSNLPGLLSLAGRGTLVIEELTELTTVVQAKLLSAMETGRYQALMSAEIEPLHVRMLFTSAQELDHAVADGELLESFLAEVRVLTVQLPPLRERREDIRPLVQAFLALAAPERKMHISDQAMLALEQRAWPGNVRELKQTVHRAMVQARGPVVNISDLPRNDPSLTDRPGHDAPSERLAEATRHWLASQANSGGTTHGSEDMHPFGIESGFLYDQCLSVVERTLIAEILQQCKGNRAAVAARLGMHRTTLRQKMKRYGFQ